MGEETRGGNRKGKAPQGFYTFSQACRKLGLPKSTVIYYVKIGKITRYTFPPKSNGFYNCEEINRMATELALFFHTSDQGGVQTRVAEPSDTPGIVNVLAVMGWQTATALQRVSWYGVNPSIDYVVLRDGQVMGYINAAPYTPEAMEAMLSGYKRAWNMTPQDILPYQSGQTFDLYVGIATRQDVPGSTWLSFRLISGFLSFLQELASQGVTIGRLFAVSGEPDGQKLCRDLGFTELEVKPEYLFPYWKRYMLDMEHSDALFARQYREALPQTN